MRDGEKCAIETRNLTYSYNAHSGKVLDGINIKIKKGKKVAVLGENGSGKSTFFLCLNGILKPLEGEVIVNGKPVKYKKRELFEVRKQVGVVFQEPDNQLFSASVIQEISFGILNTGADQETAFHEVEKVINDLGMKSFQERPVHALSGGQKKQVAIADILVMHPDIMILDEPTAALDAVHTKKVREIIRNLTKQGITVLMALHDIDYAFEWADEMILLHNGKVVCQAAPQEICTDEELLNQAGLERPSVLKLFDRLKEYGMFCGKEKIPRCMDELEEMILAEGRRI